MCIREIVTNMTLIVSPKQFTMGLTTNRNNDKEGDDDETIDLDVSTESCVDRVLSMVSSAPPKRKASGIQRSSGNFSGLRRKAMKDSSSQKLRIANRRNTDSGSILGNSQRSRMVLAAMSSPQRRLFVSQDVEREGDGENNVVLQWGTESIPVQVDIGGSMVKIPKTLIASKILFVKTRQICQLKDSPSFSSSQEGEIIWDEPPKVDDDNYGWAVTSSSTSCWWRSLASWLSMIQATILFVTPSASSKKYLLYHSKFQIKLISLSSETSSAPIKKQKDIQIRNQSSLKPIIKSTTSLSSQVKEQLDKEEIGTRIQERENEAATTTRKILLTWPEWSHACIRYCNTRKDDGEISTIPYLVNLCRQLPSIVFSMKSSLSVSRKDVLQSTIQLLSSTHCSKKKKKENEPNDIKTSSFLLWCNRIDILTIVQQRNEEQYEYLVKWLTMQICLRLTLLSKFGSKLLEKMVINTKVTRELTSLLESLALLIMNDSNVNFTTVLLQLLEPSHIDRKCKKYLLNHFEIQSSISDEEFQHTIPLEEHNEQIQIQQTIDQGESDEEKQSSSRSKILTTSKPLIMTPKNHSLQSSNDHDGNELKHNVSQVDKNTGKSAGQDANLIQQSYSMKKQRNNNPLLQRQPPSSRRNKMMMVPPNLLQQVTTTTKSNLMESPISSPSRIASTFSPPRRRGPMMMLPPPASPASPYIATPPYYYKQVVMETPEQQGQGFRSPSSFCSDHSGVNSTGTSIYDTPQKKRRQQLYSQNSKKRLPILAMESPELQRRQKKLKAANVVAQVNIAMRKQQQKKDQDQQTLFGKI